MPVFDFECLSCHTQFSELVFGQEQVACPKCQAVNPRKLISAFHTLSLDTKCNWDDPTLPSKTSWEKARQKGLPKQAPVKKVKRKKLKLRK